MDGVLVDVQPEPTPLHLEVRVGERVARAGIAHDARSFRDDLVNARRQLATLVNDGMFSLLRERSTTMRFTYDSVERWQSFLTRPRAGEVEADEELLRQGVVAIEQGRGAIISTVDHVGRAYRRLAP